MRPEAIARGQGLIEEAYWLAKQDPRSMQAISAEARLNRNSIGYWRTQNVKAGPSLFSFVGVAQALGYDVVLVKRPKL